MKNISVGLVSLGCAKNLIDSETMLFLLKEKGYKITKDPKNADVIIVNTCGFIEPAQQESVDTVLEMAQYKKGKCNALIVTGCMAEMFKQEVSKQLPEVNAVLGTGSYDKICEAVENALGGQSFEHFADIDNGIMHGPDRVLSTYNHTAYIKIAEGCNNHCAYCAIPSLRGKFRSRTIEDIVSEAVSLSKRGVKELIVIAQDTTRYGEDIYGQYSLDRLLTELCKIEGLKWIRLHYLYPDKITKSLLDVFEAEEKIVKYFDIPIQHSQSNMLAAMNRSGDGVFIRELLSNIKKRFPSAALRTTLIVGFPGETQEDFEKLCEFVIETKFDRLGAFTYSPQENTPAYYMDNRVDEEEKNRRRDIIMETQALISRNKAEGFIGKTLTVLCDGVGDDGLYECRSYMDSLDIDSKVYVSSSVPIEAGRFIECIVTSCDEYDLFARFEGR